MEVMFDPCGYSVNGIMSKDKDNGAHYTVHVTPESHCSFVSFETNMVMDEEARSDLVKGVLNIFKPRRFSIVTTADTRVSPVCLQLDGFGCRFRTEYEFEQAFYVTMENYGELGKKSSVPNSPMEARAKQSFMGEMRADDKDLVAQPVF